MPEGVEEEVVGIIISGGQAMLRRSRSIVDRRR